MAIPTKQAPEDHDGRGTSGAPADDPPPAEGERRAQRGYVRQYRSAAAAIYAGLDRGDLQWVGLADRGAGIADDVVLGYRGRVIGHQFKTSRDPSPFRLLTLLTGADGLLKPLVASWQKLKRTCPHHSIEVRLVTNDVPSTTDTLAEAGQSTAAFLREWAHHRDRSVAAWRATPWESLVESLVRLSGLDEGEFDAFMQSFFIVHGGAADFARVYGIHSAAEVSVETIAQALPGLIAAQPDKDRWTRSEFLAVIGWNDTVTRHQHRFPVGNAVQRNPSTEKALRQAISAAASGYISLVGPPGSGKSTLLQIALESEPKVLVTRYLAFVPGVGHSLGRAEAEDFLEDISVGLRESGLRGLLYHRRSTSERRDEFAALLTQAGERYAKEGVRTLVIVDGLDHVPREERPQHSFLGELPLPSAVPEGVTFILGTQRLDLPGIPPSVRDESDSAGRRVDIAPLSLPAIAMMADRMGLSESVPRRRVFEIGAGHPLATHYLIRALIDADASQQQALLDGQFSYSGDIEAVYRSAWREIAQNAEATNVLDLLARAESPMPPDLLSSLIPIEALDLAWQATRHLLADDSNGWSIFHNSFRLFILAQPHTRLGRPDEGYSARLYRQLIDLAHAAPATSAQRRLELRYMLRAGDHTEALALATPGFFRDQFLDGRSATDIQDDLRLAFASLAHVHDATVAFRLLLAADEIGRRRDSFDQASDLLDALIALGDLDSAEGYLAEAGERAYDLVDAWLQAGRTDRAQALFERIEPLHDLARDSRHSHTTLSHGREMVAWVQCAVHFRQPDQIVAGVDRIVETMRSAISPGSNDPDAFGYELREAAACAVVQLDPFCDIDALMASYRLEQQSAGLLMLLAASAAVEADELGRAQQLMDAALRDPQRLERVSRGTRRRAALDAAHNGLFDLADALYDGLDIPHVAELDDSVRAEDAKHITKAVIDHAELTELLERPVADVPASKKPLLRPLQLFASEAGRLAGMRRRNPTLLAPGDIARSAAAFLTYVSRVAPGSGGDHYFITQLGRAAPSVVKRLLATAGQCGPEELQRVVKEVDQILVEEPWARQRLDVIPQLLAEAVFAFTGDQSAPEERLETIAAGLQENTPADQLIGLSKLIVAYVGMGRTERARQLLKQMRDESLGYSARAKKDPQYVMWRDLLREANRADPGQRAGRVALLVRHVSGMRQTEGFDAAYRLAHDVIVEAALLDAGTGWAVAKRLSAEEMIGWAGKVNALMIGTVQRAPERCLAWVAVWTSLCLPFYREPYFRDSEEGVFIQHAVSLAPASDVLAAVEKLATEIAIHAQADIRQHLLDLVRKSAQARGVASASLDDAIARNSDKAPVQNSRVSSPMKYDGLESLDALAAQLHADAAIDSVGFEAAVAFRRLVHEGSFESAMAMFDRHDEIKNDSHARFALVDRALDMGRVDQARQLVNAYSMDSDRGATWAWFTGGGRHRNFRARVRMDGHSTHGEAFTDFAASLSAGRESIFSLLADVDDIWPVLTPNPNWPAMWSEVAEQLVTTRDYRLGKPLDAAVAMTDDAVVAEMFHGALSLPLEELRWHALSGALSMELWCAGGFECVIRRLLCDPDPHPDEALRLLLLADGPACADTLADQIGSFCEHPDLAVSDLAEALCTQIGIGVRKKTEPLPAFYRLALPPGRQVDNRLADPATGAPRISDAADWTRVFERVVDRLARSEVTIEHIRERCRLLIEQWGGVGAFGADATRQLEQTLKRLQLRMPFIRPHVAVAGRALRCVANELHRAGMLEPEEVPWLLFELGYGVPEQLWQVVARPDFITRPEAIEASHGSDNTARVDRVNSDIVPLQSGAATVIAEVYRYRIRTGFSFLEVVRVRTIGKTSAENAAPMDIYYALPAAYHVGGVVHLDADLSPALVRRVSRSHIPEVPEFELEFCPNWLKKLGWTSSFDSSDCLVDSLGELVAKVTAWRDAGPDGDNHSNALWGEGVVVTLTARGKEQIEAVIEPLQVVVVASRRESESREQPVVRTAVGED